MFKSRLDIFTDLKIFNLSLVLHWDIKMGLFDDIFNKAEITKLKKAVIDKSNINNELIAEIENVKKIQAEIANQLTNTKIIERSKDSLINSLKNELDLAKNEQIKLNELLELLKRSSAEQMGRSADTIIEFERKLADIEKTYFSVKSERDSRLKEIEDSLSKNNEKQASFDEREKKLAERSEKLIQERHKFQQQAIDLHSREQNWKNNIEPHIKKYEEHLSLDQRQKQLNELQTELEVQQISVETREADMVRRLCLDEALGRREAEITDWNLLLANQEIELNVKTAELTRQQTEIEKRTTKLEAWARELFVFRDRVEQLDKDTEKLEARNREFESKLKDQKIVHSVRLAELRKERSMIRELNAELNQREIYLKEREKDVKREETQIINIKNRNIELRNEQKRLNTLVESFESENKKANLFKRKFDDLSEKYIALQSIHDSAQAKIKASSKDRLEINRLNSQLASNHSCCAAHE